MGLEHDAKHYKTYTMISKNQTERRLIQLHTEFTIQESKSIYESETISNNLGLTITQATHPAGYETNPTDHTTT